MSNKILEKWTGQPPKRRVDEREEQKLVAISRSLWADAKRRVTELQERGIKCTLRDYVESALIEKQARDGQEAKP